MLTLTLVSSAIQHVAVLSNENENNSIILLKWNISSTLYPDGLPQIGMKALPCHVHISYIVQSNWRLHTSFTTAGTHHCGWSLPFSNPCGDGTIRPTPVICVWYEVCASFFWVDYLEPLIAQNMQNYWYLYGFFLATGWTVFQGRY